MQFTDTPAMAAFRDEVRAFIDAEQPDYFRDGGEIEDPYFGDGSPPFREAFLEWRRRIAGHGWIAPAWPKEYGGAGLGVLEQFVLNEEFAKHRVPRVGTDSGVMMAGPTIIAHGSEQQQREHLSNILTGETIWCQGFSEPGSGSDLASLQTRAVRDGDDYVVNGQKIWTSGARLADWMFALVRTDPDAPKHRGISYLVLPMDSPGITVRPINQMSGGSGFNEVFFEDVRVPVGNRIGEENRGWYVGVTTLDFERSGIGSAVEIEQSVDAIAGFAREIGVHDRPAVRHELAERTIEAGVLTLLGYNVVTMQARGLIPNHEASACKLFGSELSQRLVTTVTRIAGFQSMLAEPSPGWPQAVRRYAGNGALGTVASTIAGGTSEIQRNIIATRGLGLPRN